MEKNIEIFYSNTESGTTVGVGDDGKLYVDGKEVVTESKIVLQAWVNVSIIVTALATVAMAVFTVLDYFYK